MCMRIELHVLILLIIHPFENVYFWIFWKEQACPSEWIMECWAFKLQAVLVYILMYWVVLFTSYALLIPFLFDTAVTATGLIWSRYSTVITPVSFFFFKGRLPLTCSWNIEILVVWRSFVDLQCKQSLYSFTLLPSSLYVMCA